MKKIADGFFFLNEEDAILAEKEKKQIEYIEAKLDYNKEAAILKLYEKLLKERIFKTPIGMIYLKKLQDFLLYEKKMNTEQLKPIPVYYMCEEHLRKEHQISEKKIMKKQEKKKEVLKISFCLNILLIIAICFMFYVALKSEHPNILNYKENIMNQYATWEQELTEREQKVKEKEIELKIEEYN